MKMKTKIDNRQVRLCKLMAKLLENGKNKFHFCLISLTPLFLYISFFKNSFDQVVDAKSRL